MNRHVAPQALDADHKARLRLWLRLLKVSRKVETRLRERFRAEFSTTLPRFDVMAALSHHSAGLKMSELSSVLRVSNGNVTGIVDRLVDEGLVMRLPVAGDRRAMQVRLTEKGAEQFAGQASAHAAWINELLEGFDHDEAEALAARLDRLTVGLDGTEGQS